ncbi:hypothetical protein ACI0FS_17090 [Ochrobactrum quorumnocens]|uniref:hypothetical protein n=1 Tax=Ochrobactrum quorumnocens TaxID=271865 RepID=UPI003852073B
MNAAILSSENMSSISLLIPKTLGAWNALEARYASQLSPDELDHLFALYVLGLTFPFYKEEKPAVHLDACRNLLALKLAKDRVERALCAVPPITQSWVERALMSIEQLGAKDGQRLFEQRQKSNQILNSIELTPAGDSNGAGREHD